MQILTPKRNHLKTKKKKKKKENLTSVSLRVILCFLAEPYKRPWWLKILALCLEHPKRDQNPKFTPLSETTSIPVCFIYESPPRRACTPDVLSHGLRQPEVNIMQARTLVSPRFSNLSSLLVKTCLAMLFLGWICII